MLDRAVTGSVDAVQLPPPTVSDVGAAQARIRGIAEVTPVIASVPLAVATGVPVWLKAECQQVTGSFKVRGAANALMLLDEDERARGVVAVSSGNHGRAVAHVAATLGIHATICLSERVPSIKVDAIRDLGARVVIAGPDQDTADAEARRLVRDEGLVFVHPFDDPRVIAGQGTVGLEVLVQVPDATCVVVPLSGGGLISGVALAVSGGSRNTRVFGASQALGPAMHDSLAAGRLVDVIEEDTLADALAGGLGPENHFTFDLCRTLVDGIGLVSEAQIAEAMRFLHDEHDLKVEGGGAVGVAALLSGAVVPTGPTVVIVSGGNVAQETWEMLLAGDW